MYQEHLWCFLKVQMLCCNSKFSASTYLHVWSGLQAGVMGSHSGQLLWQTLFRDDQILKTSSWSSHYNSVALPLVPQNKTQIPRAEDDIQGKRQSQKSILAIYFSNSIFLLPGAHPNKGLDSKSKCNYTSPQERALNTFLLFRTRL